ncbi:uncharacterized protein K489DRAFT_371726 [Dissoconium aciculare CBS 342.82]|uniref:Uncharacterized protein n=1 Tax=Dissoconium aciculare CBS 342.82 TaxID=1314786 RepID=A0A6J3M144_9PEZI|nr:uncharacterized protein K489DRAFT_371726 [Dissoconium aciculare CBS 342.82]KAF1821755.1 hypothetical protein K489DRAFT_371726 [Dissoconium aciculare CBS 342.82]
MPARVCLGWTELRAGEILALAMMETIGDPRGAQGMKQEVTATTYLGGSGNLEHPWTGTIITTNSPAQRRSMQVSFQIDRHHRAIAPSFPDTFFPFLAPFSAARFHFHKAGHERLSPSTRSNDDDDDIVCATGQNAGTALVFIVLMYNTTEPVMNPQGGSVYSADDVLLTRGS